MNTPTQIYKRAKKISTLKLSVEALSWAAPLAAGIIIGTVASTSQTTAGYLVGTTLGLLIIIYAAIQWARFQNNTAPGDLTDWQIHELGEKGVISPFDPSLIEPNSYDVRLGTKYTRILPDGTSNEFEAEETILEPGGFLLAHTIESFDFPNNIKGILQGKSSWARLAVFVEAAGLFDSGFKGTAVLELFNCGKHGVKLRKGEKIAQMSFHRSLRAALPYGPLRGSHYQEQEGAQSSWLGKEDRIVPRG